MRGTDSPLWAQIPEPIQYSLENYIEHHIPTGDFLRAVLSGNLFRTFYWASEDSKAALPAIVEWVYRNVPVDSYGSLEVVDAWLAQRAA